MSRFLSDLLERAQNRLPLLERRPRAVFEPMRAAAGQPGLELSTSEEVQSDDAANGREESSAAPAIERQSGRVAPSARPRVEQASRPGLKAIEPAAPVADSRLAALEPAPQLAAHPPGVPAAAALVAPKLVRAREASSHLEPPIAAPIPALAPVAAPGRVRSTEPDGLSAPQRSSPEIGREAPARARRRAPDPQAERAAAISNALNPQRLAPMPTAALLAKARSPTQQALPASVPATPTAIQISIGRVEVRADAPVAPAKRRDPRPEGPRLTLEAYLNERDRSTR